MNIIRRKDQFIAICLTILAASAFAEITYYVAPTGDTTASDSSGYGTRAAPFATVEYAVDLLDGIGGTVVLLDGEYFNSNFGDGDIWKIEQTIRINNVHGTASSPIVVKGDSPTGHTLRGDASVILQLRVSSHFILEDLNIVGEVENIPLQDAWDHRFDYMIDGNSTVYQRVNPNLTPEEIEALPPLPDISALNVIRPSYYSTDGLLVQSCRYVTVRNCRVGYAPGTGLRVQSSDYVTVQGNEVHDSSRRSSVGNHGMVIHSTTNKVDGVTIDDEGYRITIIGNTVHDNYNEVYSWSSLKTFITPHIDEGKGITVQKTDKTFDNGTGRILIANNVVFSNGFSGVHTNYATKVDIYFNTAVENTRSGTGSNTGISVSDSSKCNVINNIVYSTNTFGGEVYSTDINDLVSNEVVFASNLAVGSISNRLDASNFIISTTAELGLQAAPEYRVSSNSSAIDVGDSSILAAVSEDKDGNPRDTMPDLGAYEIVVNYPVQSPTVSPARNPTMSPTSRFPTSSPTKAPEKAPSNSPTKHPSISPTVTPIKAPSKRPTTSPSKSPFASPSSRPNTPTGEFVKSLFIVLTCAVDWRKNRTTFVVTL
eukprot:CCRYP_006459-RB/>CCRYP_006459-RB protein AED:0.02 eAED:0.02 QI:95/1/1/1/0.5/0.4/5/800/596